MLIIMLLIIIHATKLVEYRLWKNYGQIIYDYSLNNMHALNGIEYTPDKFDCKYSDRGFYFDHNKTHIKMPENNYSTKSGNLKLPYTVIIWLNIFKETGRIFYRHMASNYWQMQITESEEPDSAVLTIISYNNKYDPKEIQSFKSKI